MRPSPMVRRMDALGLAFSSDALPGKSFEHLVKCPIQRCLLCDSLLHLYGNCRTLATGWSVSPFVL